MTDRVRMSFTIAPDAAAALRRLGGNSSAYVSDLILRDAIADSVRTHGVFFAAHPEFLDADQAERDAIAA